MRRLLVKAIGVFIQEGMYLRHFRSPNWPRLRRSQYRWAAKPFVNQRLLLQGKGIVEAGAGCAFGYRLGGRHRKGAIELQARYADARIVLGENVSVNNNLFICAAKLVTIGNDTLVGNNVTIFDHEAHGIHPGKRREAGEIGTVHIGTNVWIGNDVTILKNSAIGDNVIIAAGAVVPGKFPVNFITNFCRVV